MRPCFLATLSLVFAAGCTPKDATGYGGAGSSGVTTGDTGTIAEGDTAPADTGAGTTDGWPAPEDELGPSQRNPECIFDDFPNIGEVIYCLVEIRDSEGDLEGGKLKLTVSGGDFGEASEIEADVSSFESDAACSACLDGEELSFAFEASSTGASYTLIWLVEDKAGHRSNELELGLP